jgi:tol-pal system protein YbgF
MTVRAPLPGPVSRGFRRGSCRGGGVRLVVLLLLLPLAGCATKRDVKDLQDEIRTLARQQEEMLQRVESDTRAMRDSVAAQHAAQRDFRGELARQFIDFQESLLRIQELTGLGQQNLSALREQMESQRSALLSPPDVRTPPQGEEGRELAEPASGSGPAQDLYNAAVTQKNRGSLGTARRAFENFIRQHPNHTLAPEARYHHADIFVQENQLDEAISAFLRIPELHPTAPRVPDALYRVGLLHLEMENVSEAREYFERVVNSYPDSNSARLARERLNSLP